MNLHLLDQAILVFYLIGIVFLGFYLRKRAAESVEDYFLAGRRLHWIYISMSGSVSTYDITGTMWIVAMLYTMGMKGMWIHWMWGFMMPAFFMTFAGKWVRRSNVITGAEWLATRFGTGRDGRIARMTYAVAALIFLVGLIGYAFQGIGKFVAVYFDVSPAMGAFVVIGVTSVYVILGGFYSVIFTDIFQTVILTFAALAVAVICYQQISYEALVAVVPDGWMSIWPEWEPEHLADTEYKFFGYLCIAWVIKGLLLNAGGPGQMTDFQRFLATRSARDACKVGASWSLFLITRWGMCMGITALAVIGVEGLVDHEQVLPFVLNEYLPIGIKGIVLAGFFAAFMSTFDSTINTGASYLVEDIYRGVIRPQATALQLKWAGYLASLALVMCGLVVGYNAESITKIWDWLMMVLGPAFLIPNVLRWFWWRFNAWGTVGSLTAGILLCIFNTYFLDNPPLYVTLAITLIGSLIAAIVVTLLTPATDEKTLRSFYTTVCPGGFWGPVKRAVEPEFERPKSDGFARDAFNTCVGMLLVISLYLAPIYAVIHLWSVVWGLLVVLTVCTLILWRTWYPYLPED